MKKKSIKRITKIGTKTLVALIFVIFFVIPIVLTICNSFMNETEITANYGKVFDTSNNGSHKHHNNIYKEYNFFLLTSETCKTICC